MVKRSQPVRLLSVFSALFLGYGVLGGLLVHLQAVQAPLYRQRAQAQQIPTLKLEPKRGALLDRKGRPLALSHPADSLFAVSRKIQKKQTTAAALSQKLQSRPSFLLERLSRDKAFVWLKRKIPQAQAAEVRTLQLEGIDFRREMKRVYPNGTLASHLLGFVDIDNQGLEGVEAFYNQRLKGREGFRQVLRDGWLRQLPSLELKWVKPQDGLTLVLTLDEVIQHAAEEALEEAVRKWHARGGSVLVMDPGTGEILALANQPTFDLNQPAGASADMRRNRAITDLFEPGSVFKIVTAACALQEGVVKETDPIFCENGSFRVSSHVVHDVHPYGTLPFRQVIQKSSNIGTIKVAQRLKPEQLYAYQRSLGFGGKTGIDLPGEISGVIKPPRQWSGTSLSSIAIGQEVGVTAVQLARAISAIANGGKLPKPHLLKAILNPDGTVVESLIEEPKETLLSEETCRRLREILVGVVEDGTGKLARVEGYGAGGKTGTSQKVGADGRYSHSEFVASFVGFAPAESPRIAIVVTVDEPHPVYYGGQVAAPVFQKVARRVLHYLEIPRQSPPMRLSQNPSGSSQR